MEEENEPENEERQAEKPNDKKHKGSDVAEPSEAKKQRIDDPPAASTDAAAEKLKAATEARILQSDLSLYDLADKGKKALSPEEEVVMLKLQKAKKKQEAEEMMKRLHGQSEAVMQASKIVYLKDIKKITQADEQLAIKLQAELNQGVTSETPQQVQPSEDKEVPIILLDSPTEKEKTEKEQPEASAKAETKVKVSRISRHKLLVLNERQDPKVFRDLGLLPTFRESSHFPSEIFKNFEWAPIEIDQKIQHLVKTFVMWFYTLADIGDHSEHTAKVYWLKYLEIYPDIDLIRRMIETAKDKVAYKHAVFRH